MTRRPLPRLILLSLALLALPATPASAATWTVDAGVPFASNDAIWAKGSDVNAYFPGRLTIRAGDTVKFRPSGLHSVHFLSRKGGRASGSLTPVKELVDGERDAAGRLFWFNGQRRWDNTPAVRTSRFGRSFTFTGATQLNSGFRTKGLRRSMRVRFPRTGTYRFVCDYHIGMKGSVRVIPRRRAVLPRRRVAAAVKRTIARHIKVAGTLSALVRTDAPVIDVGKAARGGIEYYDFVPKRLTIPVGGEVRFQSSPGSRETHAVATGPGSVSRKRNTYFGSIARSFQRTEASPRAVYPSNPPGTTATVTSTMHGNGFWSSGILDRFRATPFPASQTVRFPQKGTFVFACLIHTYMRTAVTVG